MADTEVKSRHKGKFVGGYLTEEQIQKIDELANYMDGDPGRNRTRAMRYIIDCFNPEWVKHFPKDLASKNVIAQMNNI